MPSAAARSLTVTPERTVAGPVGAGTSSRRSVRCSPRPRRPRWRVSRCGREAAVSITTRRRPPSCGPRCGRATREPPGGLAPPAPLPPAGGRPPPAAGRWPPAAGARRRRQRLLRGAGLRPGAPGAAPRREPARAAGAGRAARLERPPPRARAAAASSTVSPCRRTPASARRRATSPGSSPRSRAMSATRFLGIWKWDCIRVLQRPPPRSGRLAKARRGRSRARAESGSSRPRRAAQRGHAGLVRADVGAASRRPGRRRARRAHRRAGGTSSCCGRLAPHPQHVRIASAIRRPRPWPGGRAGRRSASRGSRCSGSACRTPSRRRSGRRARRRSRRRRRRSRPPPRRTRSRP